MADKTIHEIFIEKNHPRWDDIENKLASLYTPPTVSLGIEPNVSVKEFGESINSIILTATTAKKFQNITKIEFFRNSVLIDTKNSPNPNGGTESFTSNTLVNNTVTFKAKVSDAQGYAENSRTISFVYPFYIGSVSTNNPTETQLKALTRLVKVKGNTTQSFTLTNASFCIAYLKSYGNLISILDQNNFETVGLYNVTTVTIAGLDNNPVDYYVYVLNNLTTQINFTNTFKF